jgi:arylsulfatase A-like enzyme
VAVSRRSFLEGSAGAAVGAVLGEAGLFAQRPDLPNVLVVIVDSLRADAVYDGWIRTPNIDALARQGLRFTDAYPEAMPTVPARNSILSGRRVFPFRGWHDHRGLIQAPGWAPLGNVDRALPAVLRRAGYWTAYVTDNPFLGFSRPYGPLRRSVNRFVRTGGQIGGLKPVSSVPDRILNHWLHPASYDAKTRLRVGYYLANSRFWEDPRKTYAGRVFRHAMNVLDDAAEKRPFALFVDTYEPHEPWTPPPKFLSMYGNPDWRGPEPAMPRYGRASNWLGADERGPVLQRIRDLYSAEVTMTDLWLGRLLDRLEGMDLERETVILLVSDHGVLLGEHGWTGKVQTALYPALINVPFIVVDPRRRHAGRKSDFFASTHDVARTVLSMAGLRVPEAMTGADLSRVFEGRPLPERPYAYGGYSDSFFIRTDRWALWAYNRPSRFRLFDLKADPGQNNDVAERHPGVVRELYGKVLARAGGRLPFYGV